ncbi:MAG: hypothetical protein ACRDBQ_18555 [Shewanella sp.]
MQVKARDVHVRQLCDLDSNQVWKLRGRYRVEFDDGKYLEMSGRHIKMSWPYWGISRMYPEVPIPSYMCYQKDVWSTDERHLDLMSHAAVLARKHNVGLQDTRFILSQHIYADAFNLTVKNLLSYCTTIDMDTMLEIYDHPEYQIIKEWEKQYPSGYDEEGHDMVEEAYKIIEKIIHSPALATNPLAMSVIDKTIKMDQVLQAFVRGKTSEIDSRVYTNQVWEGFFGGLSSVISRLKEAGATSRSHLYNTDKIAEAEYGSRKLQLAANVLTHFSYDDCGTPHFHNYKFHDTKEDKAIFASMEGMKWRFKGDRVWRTFEAKDFDELVGRDIEFRSAMCCLHLAKQGVCAGCMGDLIYNLSWKTSPGHLASTSISEKATQAILSTKHLDFLRHLFQLVISPNLNRFFTAYENSSTKGLMLRSKPELGNWDEYYIAVDDKMFSELLQVGYYEDVNQIDETSLPDVTDVCMIRVNAEGEVISDEVIDVRMGVCGNFSRAFLSFFTHKAKNGVQQIKKNDIRIPLKGWKAKNPFLVYTNRSEPMSEFVAGLETKLRSVAADKNEAPFDFTSDASVRASKKGRTKIRTLVEMGGATEKQCTYAMLDTFRYINRKLKGVPMTHVGIMLAITRVESPLNMFPAVGFDSEYASDGMGKRFLDHNTLIAQRSAAPMFFFEGQQDDLNNVGFYTELGRKRPASLYDGSFKTLPA